VKEGARMPRVMPSFTKVVKSGQSWSWLVKWSNKKGRVGNWI